MSVVQAIQTFRNKDLVLRVSPSWDPSKFDPDSYEDFLDALCGDREYQKEAIREVSRYLLGGQYRDLAQLAEENYDNNEKLKEKYPTFEDFRANLQLPSLLSCSVDHATATGKSYVMYGIARILLSVGLVDQVLVLCPSNTIETGLTRKFRLLSADKTLKDTLPSNSKITNPRITNASRTIVKGDICVENIHATYANTKSAIEDSLKGKGLRTLVLNDEAHHLMNPSDAALKKWKEFLLDKKYGFNFIANFSGTCYIGDQYFSDVVHRFSLRDAIEAHFVKSIRYVAEDSSGNEDEKFQKIYTNHIENETKYHAVKVITILITKDIAACKRLTDKLVAFIARVEKLSKDDASKKVLVVTSAQEHLKNLQKLQKVDDDRSPVEWITSVSMLSEGWDVKNVFQIVPHEERAFNSKLLIAQVLGRGLRVPEEYKDSQPTVTVFNHDRWSSSIKHLVDEVMEIEKRLHSYPVVKKQEYNFKLHNIEYKRTEEEKEHPQEQSYKLLKKGFITYSSQAASAQRETTYARVVTGEQETKITEIRFRRHTIKEAVNTVVMRLRAIDLDLDTNYSEEFGPKEIEKIVKRSLGKIKEKGNWLSDSNLQKTLQAFGVVYRRRAKSVRVAVKPKGVKVLDTHDLPKTSLDVGSIRRGSTVIWDPNSLIAGDMADRRLVKEIDDDESLPKSATVKVQNVYDFKTPVNIVFATSDPERKFVRLLTKSENAKSIDSWVKSTDVGFYGIEYSWRKGEHPKQSIFNPDFFIKKGKDVIVVEIKMDKDFSDENKAKLKYAKDHFERLNKLQNLARYYLKFLSPSSYDMFAKSIREKKFEDFISELEAGLQE